MGIEIVLGDCGDAAVLAHLERIKPLRTLVYIQCWPASLPITRSIVLLTPNGLPQRMQWNGSSSFSTRARAVAARKSSCGLRVDHLLRAGRLAQPALHAGILGEAQQRAFGIVAERAGRTGRDARQAQRAAGNVDLDRAERRALRQRDDIDRRRRRACNSRNASRITSRFWPTGKKLAGRGEDTCTSIAASAVPSASGSSVSMAATEPKPSVARIGSASAMVLVSPVMSWRGLAAREANGARTIGERGRDGFEADLRYLIDSQRQYVRRYAIAVASESVDQRTAVLVVVQQQDRM